MANRVSPASFAGAVAALLVGAMLLPAASAEAGRQVKNVKPYAIIFGTVWQGESPMYGVKVKIRRADEKKARWDLYSDHRGEFAQRVPAGTADYVVWAETEHKKHSPQLASGEVRVHIDNEERRDISLHLK